MVTHDELLEKIEDKRELCKYAGFSRDQIAAFSALRAVVELHRPEKRTINLPASGETEVIFCANNCEARYWLQTYPCKTIQAIQEQLK